MSQNGPYSGPPWPHGSSDEPYAEPADPWGDQGAPVAEQSSWGGHPPSIPQQPVGFHSAPMSPPAGEGPSWDQPAPAPPRRNTAIVALVVTLGLLIVAGLGTTAWLLNERRDNKTQAQPTASATVPVAGPAPVGSEDARFNVKKGDCVVNEGTDEEPNMRATACTSGAYEVLARIVGKTSGEKDAERKCGKVTGYTKWFFYDSPLDDLDFVLCLKEHKAL
ncbi:LppU/SCO3897 family protein [Actinoplanes sp. URMC 104]|uniref:LppU/SCO3897 family protein n=1 Tax=Actinoplanes sp. URMC 104 TaxID=3423409 RepID=UPI003F1BEBEF